MSAIFTGTAGVKLRVALGMDISDPGTPKIRAQAPDDTVKEFTATIENAIVGTIIYITAPGDLHIPGTWKLNGIWDPVGANIFMGKTACLQVLDPGEC